MATLLGQDLILELDGRRSGVLQLAHQAHHVEHLAVAGVAVDENGQPRRAHDRAGGVRELAEREDPEIGQGQACREPGTRDVERPEAGAARQERGERVVGTREAEDSRLGPEGGEAVAGGPGVTLGLGEPRHPE
jgi:hypothetical protein